MKRIALALAAVTILSSPAMAAKVGVSMALFDDNFLTVWVKPVAEKIQFKIAAFRILTQSGQVF